MDRPPPPPTPGNDVTHCLSRLAAGDDGAGTALLDLLYAELRATAAACMQGERASHTLQPTALVHEAWLRLLGDRGRSFDDRLHFMRAAARAMRRVLIDHARRRRSDKRSGGERVPLDDWLVVVQSRQLDLCALDEALDVLDSADPELARLVELRFFAGLSIAETATLTGRSTASVERDWRIARGLLRRQLGDDTQPVGGGGG